jgi:hypothetical protein
MHSNLFYLLLKKEPNQGKFHVQNTLLSPIEFFYHVLPSWFKIQIGGGGRVGGCID